MFQRIKELYIGNRIWIQPIKYILVSFLISILTVLADTRTIPVIEFVPEILLTSVGLAKDILATLSGALLTMTTFTFSTIMIVLTTYSSDFTPRVVENFLTDESTTRVLGVFIGGFFYCITSLFFMKNSLTEYLIISATIAIIYSVVCIFYFIAFVYSVSSSIQVSKLISRLYGESSDVIDKTITFRQKNISFDDEELDIYKSKTDLYSQDNGYLEDIAFEAILSYTDDFDCKIRITKRIGEFISKNQVIAEIYYNETDVSNSFYKKITDCFLLEQERKIYNDYNFSIQKITEIALRAISPGINDPNTSIHCIRILGVLIGKLSQVNGNLLCIAHENGKSKIIYQDIDLKSDIYYTFFQIVHYGKEDISVIIAIFEALYIISVKSAFKNTHIIKEFAEYVYDSSIDHFTNKLDIELIQQRNFEIQSI